MFYIVGLGNPGEEYLNTRHNTGRMAVETIQKKFDFSDWQFDKKSNAEISKGKIGKNPVTLILPDTFMNKSGNSISYFLKPPASAKAPAGKKKITKGLENLIVIHDDIDLGLGTLKISYNKGSAGHRGLESIIKAVKTQEFVRMRIGVSNASSKGKVKKPGANLSPKKSGEAVIDFILGKFKPKEIDELKKIFKKVSEATEVLITESREKSMNLYNS